MTKVKFYKDKEFGVFAYFPELPFDNNGNMTSYAHIGQHSACSKEYVKGKWMALYSEYADLLKELIGQGYKDLEVLNAGSKVIECHRNPTPFEIKQGYGATHYRSFTLKEIGFNKNGDIKKRFKADDNLIYSTQ